MKRAMIHAGLAGLLALGTVMPVLGTLGLLSCGWMAAMVILFVCALLGLLSVRRWVLALGAGVLLMAGGLWLAAMGGLADVQEVLRGVLLHATGQRAALPMIAEKTTVLLTAAMTVLCFCLTGEALGALPAILVTVLAAVMLWLCDAGALLLLLIPAAAAALTLAAVSRSEEVRVGRVLPAMALVAALAFACVPASGVTVPPMKQAAEELRQRILDYLFFTEPREVFSLASEGYYPAGIGQLGGTASPSSAPVMQVYTPKVTYLRGAVKNDYTGRVWQDTTGGRRYLWISPRWRDTRAAIFNMDLVSDTVAASSLLQSTQVTVRMLSDSQSSLFVPQRVHSLTAGGDMVLYFNNSSEIFITRNLAQGDAYTVNAALVTAGDQGIDTILAACEQGADPAGYDRVRYDYTALPEHLQSQVFEVAQHAIEGASTPYEKAMAIQSYLRRTCRYNLEVEAQPENVDFVSHFLLVTREGYCTYFASAMTVLCRMVGLPARYVEGYVASPDADGVALVTGKQAHAWTEVYFAGFGWLTFDATPPSTNHDRVNDDGGSNEDSGNPPPEQDGPTPGPSVEPTDTPEPPKDTPDDKTTPTPSPEPTITPTPTPPPGELPTPEPSEGPQPSTPPVPDGPPSPPTPWLWLILVLLILAAALALRLWWTSPVRTAARAKDELGRYLVWLQAVCELLALMKQHRELHESMAGYLRRVDGHAGERLGLDALAECTNDVFYGGCVPDPADVAAARQTHALLARQMKPVRRAQAALIRAFVPLRRRDFTKA